MNLVVDGVPMTLNLHANLDEIVYKHSGGAGTGDSQLTLRSQIPGKVISVAVKEGADIKKGDLSTDFLKRYGILDRLTADIKADKETNKDAALAAAVIHSEYFKSRVKSTTENSTRWKSQLD